MPRPSLKTRRTEEILDAYERCVARYGVEGTTLVRISETAGLARALIRHHVGNKDELLDALVERFLEKSAKDSELLFASLPKQDRIAALIDRLFDPSLGTQRDVKIAMALISAAADRPDLADRLADWTEAFVNNIANELRAAFEKRPYEEIRAIAAGIVGIYFNVDSLAALGSIAGLREYSKQAAILLCFGHDDSCAGNDRS